MEKSKEAEFFDEAYGTDSRASVGQIYSLVGNRNKEFEDILFTGVDGLRVLEYGCGQGTYSHDLAARGAQVVGIDISEVGISDAQKKARELGGTGTEYLVMDAEKMTFEANEFDMVVGVGILHHLDLAKSYSEIARVLRPSGRAVFMEPMGHNLAINLFRHFTPSLRTDDEHPLLRADLKLGREYFEKIETRYFHLASFAAMAFLKTPWFFQTVNFLDKVDSGLFRVAPFLGPYAWYSIIELSRPRT